jgi:hypothetical protein
MTAWESGSFFPLTIGSSFSSLHGTFFGSGRQALIALLRHRRCATVHLPTYYCPEVAEAVARVAAVRRYPASPDGDLVEPAAGHRDAVVAVSYFGRPPKLPANRGGTLIVDATHDPIAPWRGGLDADYVFASLRKTLPLPDGGAVWSPPGHDLPLPEAASDAHRAAAGDMLGAMALKAAYLADGFVDKQSYLELAGRAERTVAAGAPGAMSDYSRAALATFPLEQWRKRRLANIAVLTRRLAAQPGIETVPATLGVVLRCASAQLRDALRSGLVAQGVYPAILWDLDGEPVPEAHRELARRLLFLHADFRSTEDDLHCIAEAVEAAIERAPGFQLGKVPC